MVKVVKRGGAEEEFIPDKIRESVSKAAKEAGLAVDKIRVLVREIAEPVIQLFGKKEVVKTSELRKSLLGRLDRKAKKVSIAWRKHDKTVKKIG